MGRQSPSLLAAEADQIQPRLIGVRNKKGKKKRGS